MKHPASTFFVLSVSLLLARADDGAALRQACAEAAGELPVVVGAGGWLFLPGELRHVSVGPFWGENAAKASQAGKPENADPLPAILDFKAQLDAAGIGLLLVPVPAKAFVYPEAVLGVDPTGPAPPRLDTFHQQFYQILRDHGVTVIDLLPEFLAQRNGPGGPVFCRTDTHWSGVGIQIAAEKIAAALAGQPWLQEAAKTATVATARPLDIAGDLTGMRGGGERETVALRLVGSEASGGTIPVPSERRSPIVLLGDSHTLVFSVGGDMHAAGAGLPDQLLHELGLPVDLVGVRGSGATPARVNLLRRVRGDQDYLAGKKVVVWCFTVREFTEASGWNKVPLLPAASPARP